MAKKNTQASPNDFGKKLATLIEIDGGVKLDNIAELSQCGADVFVAGSAIFGSGNYQQAIAAMKK